MRFLLVLHAKRDPTLIRFLHTHTQVIENA
jgi:hypothetical protein